MPSQNTNARLYFDQGRQSFAQREYDAAADYFKKATDSDPLYGDAHRFLAETYEKLGYRHRAKKAWEALLRLTTDSAAKEEINRRLSSVS